MLPASLAACALAWWSLGAARPPLAPATGPSRKAVLVGLGTCAAIAVLFYSSFLDASRRPSWSRFAPPRPTSQRGVDPADHVHPWHFYLGILAWSSSGGLRWTEALVLVLAAVGAATAWIRRDPALDPDAAFWRRYLTANAALTLAIFSAIPYKTPWNLLPFYAATIVAAGIGVSALARATASRAAHVLMAGALAIAAGHLGWQAWRASVVYAADPRNPYVYSQTVPDAVRMAARIRDLAALHADRERMLVMVVAPPARAMAAAVVSAGDAARRLLGERERGPRPDRAGHRRFDGQCGDPRRRPRRSLRLRVLRRPARGAGDALRRARALGPVPGPRRRARLGGA